MYNYTVNLKNVKPKKEIHLKSNNSLMIININTTLNVLSSRLLYSDDPLIDPKTKRRINFTDDKIMMKVAEYGMKQLKTGKYKADKVYIKYSF